MSTTNTSSSSSLPPTYRALQIHSASEPATIVTKPSPSLPPPSGTVILKPLQAIVVSYASEFLQNGNPRGYMYPLPLVPGPSCVGRVVAVPPDAPALKPGQLVFLDSMIRTRDRAADDADIILGTHGGPSPLARAAIESAWRDGCWAELVRAPLENVHALDEAALLRGGPGGGGLGYGLHDLGPLMTLAVSFGGLDAAGVRPGETVVVAPATGGFGSGAVHVALALGARVVAVGRDEGSLAALEAAGGGRVAAVRTSGSVEGDVEGIRAAAARLGGGKVVASDVDVFFEISPPGVVDGPGQAVPYITAALKVLRKGGRAVFMGGIQHDVSLPLGDLVQGKKSIRGVAMYTPEQLRQLIRLVESGALPLGESRGFKCAGVFPLEEWQQAFDTAARESKAGTFVVLEPNKG